MINRALLAGFLLLASFAPARGVDAPETKPIVSRMLIISIDGCRPDLLLRADAPTIHGLLPQSTFTLWARTVPHAITLPAHVSMLTGVVPRKHEVEWNK